MKITLIILAKDIKENNYFDTGDCPITKALHRAGYTFLKDTGTMISPIDYEYNEQDNINLHNKLFGMYNTLNSYIHMTRNHEGQLTSPPSPIEDFSVILDIPDELLNGYI